MWCPARVCLDCLKKNVAFELRRTLLKNVFSEGRLMLNNVKARTSRVLKANRFSTDLRT